MSAQVIANMEEQLHALRTQNQILNARLERVLRIADTFNRVGRPYPQWESRWNTAVGMLLALECEVWPIEEAE